MIHNFVRLVLCRRALDIDATRQNFPLFPSSFCVLVKKITILLNFEPYQEPQGFWAKYGLHVWLARTFLEKKMQTSSNTKT
jgi:hypothetical protein